MEKLGSKFTFSIVSHGQANLIASLLSDFARLQGLGVAEIVLTINIPEDETLFGRELDIVDRVIRNRAPKGFGANHNSAFVRSTGEFFVVVNPDIRFGELDLKTISQIFDRSTVAACAPLVVDSSHCVQDSFRKFPSFVRIFRRIVLQDRRPEYELQKEPFPVDWVAGMFVVYRASAFKKVGGFDERYFMYLEDADICRRMQFAGMEVFVHPGLKVVHDAQRASRRKWRHLYWHICSMIRFWLLSQAK